MAPPLPDAAAATATAATAAAAASAADAARAAGEGGGVISSGERAGDGAPPRAAEYSGEHAPAPSPSAGSSKG